MDPPLGAKDLPSKIGTVSGAKVFVFVYKVTIVEAGRGNLTVWRGRWVPRSKDRNGSEHSEGASTQLYFIPYYCFGLCQLCITVVVVAWRWEKQL